MLPAGEPSLMHGNRAFCYGDALFETIHGNGTRLQFFKDHHSRLQRGMEILGMDKNSLPEPGSIESAIVRLLNKNHLYNGVRVRLTVFRNGGGFFTPDSGSCSFLAEASPLPYDRYRLNEKGLKVGLYNSLIKQADSLANLKTANSLLYIMAGLHKKEAGLDDCIILNTENRLAECISSNLFLIKKGVLFTPALSEGCVEGIMRRQILRIAEKEGIGHSETRLGEEDLNLADEFFLTNSITGIRWVVAYGKKRYFSKTSKKLIALLNREQFGD